MKHSGFQLDLLFDLLFALLFTACCLLYAVCWLLFAVMCCAVVVLLPAAVLSCLCMLFSLGPLGFLFFTAFTLF